MSKSISIKTKITIAILLVSFLFLVIQIGYNLYSKKDFLNNEISNKQISLIRALDYKIESKFDIGLTNAVGFASNKTIIESLKTNNRELAISEISTISKNYKDNTNFKGVQIHIHSSDFKSFIRSWKLDKFGDELEDFRGSIKKVKADKKAVSTFELGRAGLLIRGVVPVLDNNEYVGSLEFTQGVGSVSRDFESINQKYIMLLNPDVLDVATDLKNNPKVGEYIVSNPAWFSNEMVEFAKTIDFKKLFEDGYIMNDKFFATYKEIHNFDGKIIGFHLIGENVSILNTKIEKGYKEIIYTISITLINSIFLLLMIILLINKMILSRVLKLKNSMEYISKNRDLCENVKVVKLDEIGEIRHSFNILVNSFRELILDIQHSSTQTASIANEVTVTSKNIGEKIENESKIIKETEEAFREIRSTLQSSVVNAEETKKDIEISNQNLQNAKEQIFEMIDKIQNVSDVETQLSSKLSSLSNEAKNVKNILTVINDIAEQTNLLALNAAIEAARAGEHGRGFAVVAENVRELAERTKKSLTEINATINLIVDGIVNSSEEITQNVKLIHELEEFSNSVQNIITDSSKYMISSIEVADSSLKDTILIADISEKNFKKMEEISEISTHNTKGLEENIEAIKHLQELVEILNHKTNQFKV